MLPHPDPSGHASFFQGYVDLAIAFADAECDGDVLDALVEQGGRMQRLLDDAGEAKGDHAYAPGKWTVKRVVLHIADGERMFCYRAMCIARGDTQELPGFDEGAYAELDGSEDRTLVDIADEYASVRAATMTLFHGFGKAAWARVGRANGAAVAVAALPWIVLGHDLHHCGVLRDRYGL